VLGSLQQKALASLAEIDSVSDSAKTNTIKTVFFISTPPA
jgi:hypothetical protein